MVRLVDRHPPRLLVTGRTSTMLNVVGEHLSGEQLEDAGGRARHVLVVEFAAPPAPASLAAFAQRFDATLQAGSLDYRERRAAEIGLLPPELVTVPPGFFAAWMKRHGRLGGQNKVPRVLADETMLNDLLTMDRNRA